MEIKHESSEVKPGREPGFVGTTANTVWGWGCLLEKKNTKLGTGPYKGPWNDPGISAHEFLRQSPSEPGMLRFHPQLCALGK